jgi:hypothetical protein
MLITSGLNLVVIVKFKFNLHSRRSCSVASGSTGPEQANLHDVKHCRLNTLTARDFKHLSSALRCLKSPSIEICTEMLEAVMQTVYSADVYNSLLH